MPSAEAIWGYGETEQDAWDMLEAENPHLMDSDTQAFRASPELVAKVEDRGGNTGFIIRGGIAQLID